MRSSPQEAFSLSNRRINGCSGEESAVGQDYRASIRTKFYHQNNSILGSASE